MLHYQIEVTTKKEFDRIFIKLAKLGFVYLGGSRKPTCFSGWDEGDPLRNIIKLCC